MHFTLRDIISFITIRAKKWNLLCINLSNICLFFIAIIIVVLSFACNYYYPYRFVIVILVAFSVFLKSCFLRSSNHIYHHTHKTDNQMHPYNQ